MDVNRINFQTTSTRKQIIKFKILLATILLSASVSAAEIRGRIWSTNDVNVAPPGSILVINCGGTEQPLALAGDGSFSLRSLPANTSCTVKIVVNAISSPSIPIRTNATVVNFNAEVIIVSNGAVIMLPR